MGCYPTVDEAEAILEKETTARITARAYPADLQVELLYIRDGIQYSLEVSQCQFDSKGAFRITGRENSDEYKLIGSFALDGEVESAKYSRYIMTRYHGKLELNEIKGQWESDSQRGEYSIRLKGELWTSQSVCIVLQSGLKIAGLAHFDSGWCVVTGQIEKGVLELRLLFADGTEGTLVGVKEEYLFVNVTVHGHSEKAYILQLKSSVPQA